MEHKKKKKHDCASKVKSEQYGIGHCVPEQHTMLEDGTVTHYDVLFDHGLVENVPVSELEILQESMHEHYDNDDKNAQLAEDEFYSEHMCAKHVLHPEFGEGYVLEGQHDVPDQDGNIAWYNVEFDHGIETIATEEVMIMHEAHHGHKMKKKKPANESRFVENFIDNVFADKSTAAKQDFESAISQKLNTALASKKQEMAQSTFSTEAHHMGVNVDSKKRMAQAKKNITDVDKVDDVSGIKEGMHKNKKQMDELGGSMMRRRAGAGQTSAY